ncbi:cytochrome P450 [Streptomyces sp. NRRL S-475]|uniref:cytochrome P450 n=1 Tax=Streptomyces sp. NRRL S-475 TaxID=1463910 RepID=UPI000995EACC|nr:cytochrome P450 [Streptomyces sp. NRRL S-475]
MSDTLPAAQDTAPRAGRCPYHVTGRAQADPCMDYLHLRDDEPVRWDEDLGVWLVTGFREATELLRNPSLSAAWPEHGRTRLHTPSGGESGDGSRTSELVRMWFMFNDDPGHAAARKIVAPLFSAERLAAARTFVEGLVDELLAPHRDVLDVMDDLAVPLSSRVICHILGLPEDVAPRLAAWAPDIAALLVADYLPEVVTRGYRALHEVTAAVDEALRGEVPENSGLWLLREAHRRGEIGLQDVWATASLLIYAGFETTSTFIGKAVRATLHAGVRPGDLKAGPAAAVEELLRFDTSVQQVARFATAPIDVAGQRVAAGDLVLIMLGAANRDPDVFEGPDHLRPGREIRRHLTFGFGAHYCLGAGLARLEAEAALRGLGERWDVIEEASAPVTRSHYGLTVLEHLKVRGGTRNGA